MSATSPSPSLVLPCKNAGRPAADKSKTGCWMRSLIVKTSLSLPGRHLAPMLADTDTGHIGQEGSGQNEAAGDWDGKEKRRTNESQPQFCF